MMVNLVTGFCLLMSLWCLAEAKRAVSVDWNPRCPSDIDCAHSGLEQFPDSANSLLHFVAQPDNAGSSNQTVHILFSTVGGPAVLMVITDQSASVEIKWRKYLNETTRGESLVVTGGEVYHSMGVMFSRIWKFNDGRDLANVDVPTPLDAIVPVPLERLLWRNVSVTNGTTIEATLSSSGEGDDGHFLGENGTLRISMEVFDSDGRSSSLPRLPHTDVGFQLDVELVDIDVGNFSEARLAIETVSISQAAMAQGDPSYELTHQDSIDDEYTPGVFRTYYLSMPVDDGFLMWKPVAYRDPSRSFSSFTRAKYSDAVLVANISSLDALNMSNVISAYYGSSFPRHSVAFNITFGLQKDKFYNSYRCLVWSLGVGWGSKPPETLSTLVMFLVILSLAFPVLALIVGLPYFLIRRRRAALPYHNLEEEA